ncbi:aminotransferase class I/II-fold pyridoxal phosphate-dependent enzyme [Propylenella binzhouense]|uniref:Aminotransferase n=1 Tax=Propylenella binzhouense TaxID=2555902 RepID=A0A964T3M9_9HYPH|nr:aminotransferase class I/II-fold pyridoxal phosphate-dependent enzyme [Propylenella binzhouense]MYZ47709.1 pyridoxal phosphate-dependent class II aminotransferase [Propylenella binzhouense]
MRHGGDLGDPIRRYKVPEADWLDLSTGVNPHPWPAHRMGAAALGRIDRLPARADLDRLISAARAFHAVPPDLGLIAAPGTEPLIRLLPDLVPGPVALADTSYRSYGEAWRGAHPARVAHDGAALSALPSGHSIVLVNPNNPDGHAVSPIDLRALAGRRTGKALVVVDEAFADVEDEPGLAPHLDLECPVLVFKSFGKFFGLPGIRLGFAIGPDRLLAPLRLRLGDWPVSAPALAIGTAALLDTAWHGETRRALATASERLRSLVEGAGLAVAGGCRLFVLAAAPDAPSVHARLAARGIWTRIFDDRPGLIRIGLPPDDRGFARLEAALASL